MSCSRTMLFRFSLYGFLKNQRYFEPFIVLAMLDVGLSFAQIGLLVAMRELVTAAVEVPSGLIADAFGRRRAMVAAFGAYAVAYVALGLASTFAGFGVGMVLIGLGDAFRSGTHKAMIFDWLDAQGRSEERVQVYGYTRSWSLIGSAVSVPLAATAVLVSGSYTPVFWLAVLPAVANGINLATYPRSLEVHGADTRAASRLTEVWRSVGNCLRDVASRRLLAEASLFSGTYKVAKDYLQPVAAAMSLILVPAALARGPEGQAAIAVGVVYVVIHLASAFTSRRAHAWVRRWGDPFRAARGTWFVAGATYALLLLALWFGFGVGAVVGFVVLALLHNLFRPILVARIDALVERKAEASVLSLESQANSASALLLAPLVGYAVDAAIARDVSPGAELWPIAVVGVALCAFAVLAIVRRPGEPAARPRASA